MAGRACPETVVDLWADDVLVDPYPTYAALRDLGPVVRLVRHDAVAATTYDAVREVLQDWETYSSARGVGMSAAMNARHGGVLTTDPPEHDPLRAALNRQLLPRRLGPHHDQIDRTARRLVDRLVRSGRCDAVTDLGQAYSLAIVADLVGFPQEGREHLIARATAAFNTFGPDNELLRTSVDGLRDLFLQCTALADLHDFPPGTWGRELVDSARDGLVGADDVKGLLLAYAWAGMDTTASAISTLVHLFATHPEQWDLLRSDRSLLTSAVNEVLRVEPVVHRFTRATTRSTELAGHPLDAGTRVVVLFASANRDPAHYPDPDRFDVRRNPVDHLSFGRGIHRCVGAGLAHLELAAITDALLDRVGRFEVTDRVWRANNALHGLARLDTVLHPA